MARPLGALCGLCALAYEVLWARMLALQFGVSTFAAIVTVAAFMLGLAAGSGLMAGRAAGCRQPAAPARAAGSCDRLLRAGAAVGRAPGHADHRCGRRPSVAPALACAHDARGTGAVDAAGRRNGRGFSAAARGLEALPTRHRCRLWQQYARGRGRRPAAAAAAAHPGLEPCDTGGGSARPDRRRGPIVLDRCAPGGAQSEGPAASEPKPSVMLLLNYGIVGAASLLLEMAWMRLFSLVMLRTEYVLGLILAVMLFGMGLGSLIASRRPGSRLMALLPWCASGCAIAGLWLLPALSGWIERIQFNSLGGAMLGEGLLLAALTLPATLSLGAWLPALSRKFSLNGTGLYAANSLGAAFGALLYALLIPYIGSSGALALAAVLLLLMGLILGHARRAWLGAPLILAAAWSVAVLPQARDLLPRAMAGSRDLYRYEDAIALTQVVEQRDGQRVLLTDLRRWDASTEPTAVFVQSNQARLPLLLHERPRSVLFLGIGTGISLAGSLPFPDLERSAVELSQGSIDAAEHWFAQSNQGVLRETQVHRDDARHFLCATPKTYDVIIGDLFHPDLAGVGSLLSVEQFARVRERLADQGLFVQWLALNQFDRSTLAIVLRSFRQVYPEAQLFLDGLHLALVGPRGHWQGAPAIVAHLDSLTAGQRAQISVSEGAIEWLGALLGADQGGCRARSA